MLKIIYFLDFPNIGGAGKVLLTQAHIMSRRGHEVIVVMPDSENDEQTYEFEEIGRKYGLHMTTAGRSLRNQKCGCCWLSDSWSCHRHGSN